MGIYKEVRDGKTIFELQEELHYEWEEGDDGALYEAGYSDGIIKAIEILDSVRKESEVDRLPSGFTVSVVIATLRKVLEGKH